MFVRTAEVNRIVTLLLSARSVNLVGARWSGRSELLERVRRELLAQDKQVIVIRGIGPEIPLEAVRIALPAASRKNIGPRGSAVGAMIDELERASRLEPTVLLVDDADLLDRASWVVVESLHKSTRTPVFATELRRHSASASIPSLMSIAHPAVQIALDDVAFDVTHGLLESRMEGPVDPGLAGSVHTMSGGVPGLSLAIIESAVAAGLVRRKGSVWRGEGDLWNDDLVGVFSSLLSAYPPQLQEAAETLSIAGVTEWRTAETLVGQEALEALEGHGLARVLVSDGRALMAITPGGIVDYFHNQPLSARRMRLVERASKSLSEIPSDERVEYVQQQWGQLSSASRNVPMWHSVETPVIVRMFAEDLQVKRTLADRRWNEEPSMRSASDVLVLALSGGEAPASIDDVVTHDVRALPGDAIEEVELRWLLSRIRLTQGASVTDAQQMLEGGVREGFTGSESLRVMSLAVGFETLDASSADIERLRASAQGSSHAASLARTVLAALLTVRGAGAEALQVIEDAHLSERTPLVDSHLAIIKGLALLADGQFHAAVTWASAHLEKGMAELDRGALAGHAFVAATGNAVLAQYNDATDVASLPFLVGARSGSLLLSPDRPLLILLWTLAALDDRHPRTASLPFSEDLWAQAMSRLMEGQRERAGDDFADLATTVRERGYLFAWSLADFLSRYSYVGARDPEPREELQRTDGDLFDAFLAARHFSVVDDAAGVERAAGQLLRLHAVSASAHFFGQAARLYREAGARDDVARLRSKLDEIANEARKVPLATLDTPLTSREAELVRLIAAGLSNGQIATRLVLSVRTVESHINNIRRKTGLTERSELARLSSFA